MPAPKSTVVPDNVNGALRLERHAVDVEKHRAVFDSPFADNPGSFGVYHPLSAEDYMAYSRRVMDAVQIDEQMADGSEPDIRKIPIYAEFIAAAPLILEWDVVGVDLMNVRNGNFDKIPMRIMQWVRVAVAEYVNSEFSPKELLRTPGARLQPTTTGDRPAASRSR